MSISTGGPHILLFERDQKLAALLMSELQLAGYEGHTARTAVEVFDIIARYPIRFVLINLAQAAAARREFWVALDTQRRGNNMQVLTFHCTNLAGYGPRDADERSAPLADMEIDGMLGLMALVNAVRARVPLVDQNSITVPRLNRVSNSTIPLDPRYMHQSSTQGPRLPDQSNNQSYVGNNQAATRQYQQSSPPDIATTPQVSSVTSQTYSEKIRAVIYPNQQRAWNSPAVKTPEADMPSVSKAQAAAVPQPIRSVVSLSDTPMLQCLANGELSDESGLAQLTRLVQESHSHVNSVSSPVHPTSETIGSQPLRLAPIQELPDERPVTVNHNADAQRRPDVLSRANHGLQSTVPQPPVAAQPPLASIATSSSPVRKEVFEPASNSALSSPISPNAYLSAKAPQVMKEGNSAYLQATKAAVTRKEKESELSVITENVEDTGVECKKELQGEQIQDGNNDFWRESEKLSKGKHGQEKGSYKDPEDNQFASDEIFLEESSSEDDTALAKNSVILDILKSLPPMPALGRPQAIQPQVLNGKATRSLKNVLLGGHLVPEDRLEVAQNIQRMLRGVDLNYQLGEILLMFKLLTPDQLLAASLVSYGVITTAQISSFGRIRQELHSIGLEYDLENLLILFRVLTPEQLREVRAHIES
jgi:hypothetical protein